MTAWLVAKIRVSPAPKPVVVPQGIGAPCGWCVSFRPCASLAIAGLVAEQPVPGVGGAIVARAVPKLTARIKAAAEGKK